MKGGNQRFNGFNGQKLRLRSGGFTIIEVMIVMAIAGLLLTSAIILVGGKQNQAEFQQAINQVTSQIQQAIDDVSNGYYPNLTDFSCTSGGGPISINAVSPGVGSEGTNSGCIYLGKVLIFQAPGNTYNAYTLAGSRLQAGGSQDTTGLSGSNPALIVPSSTQNFAPNDDFTPQSLENGLSVSKMRYNGLSTGNVTGAVAFIANSLGSYNGNVLSSGSQQVNLYAVKNTNTNKTFGFNINVIDGNASYIIPVNDVEICFASGTTNQSGLVTIAYGGGKVQSTVSIKNGTVC